MQVFDHEIYVVSAGFVFQVMFVENRLPQMYTYYIKVHDKHTVTTI